MSLSGPQRLCIALIVVGFVTSLVGIVSPYWEYYSLSVTGSSGQIGIGLIFGCYSYSTPLTSKSKCQLLDWDPAPDNGSDDTYFKAVRILMGVSLFLGLCSSLAGLILCCKTTAHSALAVSVLAIMSGLTGIAGVVTFAVCSKGDITLIREFYHIPLSKAWALYLSAGAAGFTTLLGLLTPFFPKQKQLYMSSTVHESNQLTPTKGYGRFY